jgi:hypothetical protein
MADDRLPAVPPRRSLSMLATRAETVSPRRLAISLKEFQNASSRLTAVLRAAMVMECLGTGDFMMAFRRWQCDFRNERLYFASPPVSRRGAGSTIQNALPLWAIGAERDF